MANSVGQFKTYGMVVASIFVLQATKATMAASPYSDSSVITGISFNWATHQEKAAGSDNFPVTWADDDHQYTAWGDGWGFAVSGTKKSLGVSRVSGTKSSYSGTDLWSGDGKSYGIICINSILYMWVGPGSDS